MQLVLAEGVFRGRLAAAGLSLTSLLPKAGIESMLSFYADVRMEGCALDADGDMLLFQWGTYDFGEGLAFRVDITRQLIATTSDHGDMRQMNLVFLFPPTPESGALGAANRWCYKPRALSHFRQFVMESPVVRAFGQRRPGKVELHYGPV